MRRKNLLKELGIQKQEKRITRFFLLKTQQQES